MGWQKKRRKEKKSAWQIKQKFIQKSIEMGPTKMFYAMRVWAQFSFVSLFSCVPPHRFVFYSVRFFGPGTSIIRERKVSCSGRFYILLISAASVFFFFCSLFIFFYSSSPGDVVFVVVAVGCGVCVCVCCVVKSNGYKPKESKCHRIYCC